MTTDLLPSRTVRGQRLMAIATELIAYGNLNPHNPHTLQAVDALKTERRALEFAIQDEFVATRFSFFQDGDGPLDEPLIIGADIGG